MTLPRKYFGTDGIRGRVGVHPLTAAFALQLGWSVGKVLAREHSKKVLIGKDTRLSGAMLSAALEAGFMAAGVDVCGLGCMPTPAVAYLTRTSGALAGVVVSASHNPYEDNGVKFFNSHGQKLPDLLEKEIEDHLSLAMATADPHHLGKSTTWNTAAEQYIAFCKESLRKPFDLKGLKLVLDCANGATSHIAPIVFQELGAKVLTIHHNPNGCNINDQCGSTHPALLQKAVLTHQADLGIAFDGDGDRLILVDHQGQVVDGDEILLIIARAYQTWSLLQGGVVGTQMSNLGLEKALRQEQIPFIRAPVGDRHVLAALAEKGWHLGGETSGHIICLDKTTTGDGIVSALQVLGAMCEAHSALSDLKKGMQKCAQVLWNVPTSCGAEIVQDPRVQKSCMQAEKQLAERGRIVLRPSGTEPVVRVMVEGEDAVTIQKIAERLASIITSVGQSGSVL